MLLHDDFHLKELLMGVFVSSKTVVYMIESTEINSIKTKIFKGGTVHSVFKSNGHATLLSKREKVIIFFFPPLLLCQLSVLFFFLFLIHKRDCMGGVCNKHTNNCHTQ
jgi:hypothetical protein